MNVHEGSATPQDPKAPASDRAPQVVLNHVSQTLAEDVQKRFKKAGATAQTVFVPVGTDLERHWGARRTVGADLSVDERAELGELSLASFAVRSASCAWSVIYSNDRWPLCVTNSQR